MPSKFFTKSLFGIPVRNPKLAMAISTKSPSQFRQSFSRVKKIKGLSPLTKRRGLILAQNRARLQLKRKNLSSGERKQFKAISKTKLPTLKQLG